MKKNCCLLLLIVSLFFVSSANAATSFIIEQTSEGQFDIIFSAESDVDFYNFNFGFTYDTTKLSYSSFSQDFSTGYFNIGGAPAIDNTAGVITNFNGANFSVPPTITGGTEILLGSFTFNVLGGAILDGEPDFYWNVADLDFSYLIDEINYSNSLSDGDVTTFLSTRGSLDVGSPVPVPSTFLLLGSGICAVFGISRRKKRE